MTCKFLVSVKGGLQVASVSDNIGCNDNAAFSFQVINIDAERFAFTLDSLIESRDNEETYFNSYTIDVGDIQVYKFSGFTCSIIANHCRVLYHGSIDRLRGLPKAIRKEINKQDNRDEN